MSSPTFWADAIRALVMIEFFTLIGQSVATILLYARARRMADHALGVPKAKTRQMGLLPAHVALVSASLLALAFEVTVRTWNRVGTSLIGWGMFNLLFLGVANLAVWEVLRFERTRVAEARRIMMYRIDPPEETIEVDEVTHDAESHHRDGT